MNALGTTFKAWAAALLCAPNGAQTLAATEPVVATVNNGHMPTRFFAAEMRKAGYFK